MGDVSSPEVHGASDGVDETGDGFEHRRLAGAVRPQQGDDLALLDLEVDTEQHLHAVIGHVQATAGDEGGRRRRLFELQRLGHVPGDEALDGQLDGAPDGNDDPEHDDGGPLAVGVTDDRREDHRTRGEEHQRPREGLGPEPGRRHQGDHRLVRDLEPAGPQPQDGREDDRHPPPGDNPHDDDARRELQDEQAVEHGEPLGPARLHAPGREASGHQEADDPDRAGGPRHQAPLAGGHVVHVLEVEVHHADERRHPGAEEERRRPRPLQRADGTDPAKALAHGHVAFVGADGVRRLAPGRLPEPRQQPNEHEGGQGQDHEGGAPPSQRGDDAGQGTAGLAHAEGADQVEAEDRGQDLGRVVVGQEAGVHGLVDGLADPRHQTGDDEDAHDRRQAGDDGGDRPHQARQLAQAHPVGAVCPVAEGDGGEQGQDPAEGADREERRVRQVERVADVGGEDLEAEEVEPLDSGQGHE